MDSLCIVAGGLVLALCRRSSDRDHRPRVGITIAPVSNVYGDVQTAKQLCQESRRCRGGTLEGVSQELVVGFAA